MQTNRNPSPIKKPLKEKQTLQGFADMRFLVKTCIFIFQKEIFESELNRGNQAHCQGKSRLGFLEAVVRNQRISTDWI